MKKNIDGDISNLVGAMYKAAATSRDSVVSLKLDDDEKHIWLYAFMNNIEKCGPSLYISKFICPKEMFKYLQGPPVLFKKIKNQFRQNNKITGRQLSKFYILLIGGSSWVKLTAQNKAFPLFAKNIHKNISSLNMIPINPIKFMPLVLDTDKHGMEKSYFSKRNFFFDKEVRVVCSPRSPDIEAGYICDTSPANLKTGHIWRPTNEWLRLETKNAYIPIGKKPLVFISKYESWFRMKYFSAALEQNENKESVLIDNNHNITPDYSVVLEHEGRIMHSHFFSLLSIPCHPSLFAPTHMGASFLRLNDTEKINGCFILRRKDEYLLIPKRRFL